MYRLPSHVFACLTNEAVIFLDLRRNKYVGVRAAVVDAISTLLDPGGSTRHGFDSVERSNEGIEGLIQNGLLLHSSDAGKAVDPPRLHHASVPLLPEDMPDVVTIRAGDVLLFARAVLAAHFQLKTRSLEAVVTAGRRRRTSAAFRDLDVARTRALVTAFRRLRPFLFAARNACLFDSLALLNFLRLAGIYPHWVFGVRSSPFAAHCWLQQGNTVLNDTPQRVTAYTPIMVV